MSKKHHRSLRTRITLATLVTVLIACIANGAAILWNYNELTYKALQRRVDIESQIISSNIAPAVLFDDVAAANETLATFAADPALVSLILLRSDGSAMAKYINPKFDKSSYNALSVEKAIKFDDQIIGVLKISVSTGEIDHQNITNIIFVTITLSILLLLTILIIRPLIKSILIPLLNLHNISERIAKTRNYTLRAQVHSNDEVGQLSTMFNHMVEQIEHRDDMLEKQVSQRTNELEKLAEEFRFRAFHDSLTGLPNRALLNERFEQCTAQASRNKTKFACMLLDLDDFKTINDTKGHEFGDELLIQVSKRLKNTVRKEDLVCRLGGDEFVILLTGLNELHEAEIIARKILAQLNREFLIKSERIRTAASIGGAIYPTHGENMSAIKRHADVAMYRAKDAGKNRFCLFTDGMQQDVKYRLMIQNGLKPALQEKQFEVYVQPKVDPARHQVSGCEALVRWNHPTEGFLTPEKFVPYAEEIGVISQIDYFVINECCALLVKWAEIFTNPLAIAVNLSGRHFHDYHIVDELEKSINRFQIDPSLLEIEITEAVLIEDPDKAQKIVRAIKSLGVGISLDDFGTGYSSLNYLRTMPIDTVKLDRSFVKNIDTNLQDKRLTRGIVSLARGLNLKMVAEGVENDRQLQTLMELGCETMQGYYFLKPVPNSDFIHWHLKNYSLAKINSQ